MQARRLRSSRELNLINASEHLAKIKGEVMKKTWSFAGLLTVILMLCGLNAFGQQPSTTAPVAAPETRVSTVAPQGERIPAGPGPNTFSFVNSEFVFDGKPITGSPYSAEAVTETTQVLADGNRIVNRSTASLYRDSEGRTRREQTLKAIGGVSAGAQPLQTIMISDPVTGVSYSLDPATRTARKSSITFQRTVAAPSGTGAGSTNFVFSEAVTPRASVAGGGVMMPGTAAPSITWSTQSGGGAGYTITTRDGRNENVNKEDLGTQVIEGVTATGTRHTFTIPAEQIGNERPIEIVDERWFSKDLQAFVMTRHSDPRSGETVYRLTNISRTEPDHSLFEVPADYVMKESTSFPARTRKPE
jgi:hypothetical protein